MAGDPEDSTVNCVDAWVAKLLDGKTLAESEVVQLCNKVKQYSTANWKNNLCELETTFIDVYQVLRI